jgi:repressor LexA
MRSKNPEIMNRISEFAGNYYRNNHASPTIREIAEGIGISKSTVHSYLEEMDEKKMLSYGGRKNISNIPKISKTPQGYFSAPVVGSVRCGDPENEEEEVEMYVSLPEAIFGTGDFYMVRAMGDSMVDAGINDGDYVLIKKQSECEPGDIVVALDENSENTLKVFEGIDPQSDKAILAFANEAKYPGAKIEVAELTVQGVAKNVISRLPLKHRGIS